jgi:hypothetical protein
VVFATPRDCHPCVPDSGFALLDRGASHTLQGFQVFIQGELGFDPLAHHFLVATPIPAEGPI